MKREMTEAMRIRCERLENKIWNLVQKEPDGDVALTAMILAFQEVARAVLPSRGAVIDLHHMLAEDLRFDGTLN